MRIEINRFYYRDYWRRRFFFVCILNYFEINIVFEMLEIISLDKIEEVEIV